MPRAPHRTSRTTPISLGEKCGLVSYSVPRAVARGRNAVRSDLHAFLPTVFRNAAYGRSPTVVARCMGQYEQDLADLSRYCTTSEVDLPRPALQNKVSALLDGTGVAAVVGPRYSGRSHALRRAVRDRLALAGAPKPRPIFYVDCGPIPPDRAGPVDLLGWVTADFLHGHRGVLPENTPLNFQGMTPERAYQPVDSCAMVLVLDNLRIAADGPLGPGWVSFLRAAACMTASLVLIVPEDDRLLPPQTKISRMEYFSLEDTRAYVERFLGRGAPSVERVQEYSAGVPAILDALRRQAKASGRIELPLGGLLSTKNVDAIYARTLLATMDTPGRGAVCRLLYLPGPTAIDLAHTYLLGSDEGILTTLIDLGIVVRSPGPQVEMIEVDPGGATALRLELGEEVAAAALGVLDTFTSAIIDDLGLLVEIYKRPGGVVLLLGVQEAAIRAADPDRLPIVSAIASLVDTNGVSKDLLSLYGNAVRAAAGTDEATRLRIRAARIAQAIGAQAKAKEYLAVEPASLEPYLRAAYLHAHASYLKDSRQTTATEAILAELDEGVRLATAALASADREDGSQQDWSKVLVDLLQNRIATRLFLLHSGVDAIQPDLDRIRGDAAGKPAYANALCTIVESELKKESLSPEEWDAIAERLAEAYHLLEKGGDDRDFNYCCYQYGQYLRKRPNPRWSEALKLYREAETAAERAGEPRRRALAAFWRIAILWRGMASGSRPGIDGADACAEIDRLTASLQAERGDALTLRALQRLFGLRAEIGRTIRQGPVDGFLREACLAGTLLPEGSPNDDRRLAEACSHYLECILDQGESVEARDFLFEFKDVLSRRLKLDRIRFDDPQAVQQQMARLATGQNAA